MTTVYFVRHAHSVYTPDELGRPLSSEGMMDAERVTEILGEAPIEVVLSSPYRRAIQTVQGAADYFGLTVEVHENLKERTLSKVPIGDFATAIKKVWQEPDFSWKDGESNNEAQSRGIQIFEHILEKYDGKNIVIGSHGNIMVLIMNHYNSAFDLSFWNNLDMPDIYKLIFNNSKLISVEKLWER
ncbi:histidine phosphatase family protein [Sutcliffiella rhizosphaerae]|uniref:Histidine phosphatase family protein n=1 Tax=Sutcliffiella rhizosphaerae TaxID=2880967 RepID=A0ABM8YR72_9BACI|nr:histidine phosphatase family protein [Sutcliffiella rhizosphaerae]CAG9622493.1 hypothetical protein BACCIP111883_03284 [Sutcliffiella rhizosphaerae]